MKDDKYLGSCNPKDDNKLHNPPPQTKNKTKQKKNKKTPTKRSDTADLINSEAKIELKQISRVSHGG